MVPRKQRIVLILIHFLKKDLYFLCPNWIYRIEDWSQLPGHCCRLPSINRYQVSSNINQFQLPDITWRSPRRTKVCAITYYLKYKAFIQFYDTNLFCFYPKGFGGQMHGCSLYWKSGTRAVVIFETCYYPTFMFNVCHMTSKLFFSLFTGMWRDVGGVGRVRVGVRATIDVNS